MLGFKECNQKEGKTLTKRTIKCYVEEVENSTGPEHNSEAEGKIYGISKDKKTEEQCGFKL